MKKIIISKKYLKKAELEETKPVGEGMIYTPELEDEIVDKDRGRLRQPRRKGRYDINPRMSDNEWISLIDEYDRSESDKMDRLDSIFREKLEKTQSSKKSIIICKK